ncbi:unnamed protein product [Spirodela intermedia]|uniref:2Fe-2S ferredoxin-type domain-containing protein n=1 Tax=Spirodela intermedia TaxID=51605 RepID=A0A7I8JN98_SPIIN|nr:unnamed protein product [Spirodela intermedia]CAA6671619.1 unnamed protein product [Spirodela intermedia]
MGREREREPFSHSGLFTVASPSQKLAKGEPTRNTPISRPQRIAGRRHFSSSPPSASSPSRLLPDGSPDVQIRSACGGQKLRDIMLDGHIDLYGPYARPLLNCGGGGTCGTCLVEVLEGKEVLSPRTEKEKEALKKKPKTWRLACQTVVGSGESRGQVVIQQLPEWKAHEWKK